MTKQTAVDFLIEKFSKHYAIHQLTDEIEQAKEMEKEQIINAANNGFKSMCHLDSPRDGEQYYKQLYENIH